MEPTRTGLRCKVGNISHAGTYANNAVECRSDTCVAITVEDEGRGIELHGFSIDVAADFRSVLFLAPKAGRIVSLIIAETFIPPL